MGTCLSTSTTTGNGQERVVATETIQSSGYYTIVTENEFLVINGVVASPFAVSHSVANAYYTLYRTLFAYLPTVLKSDFFIDAHSILSGMVFTLEPEDLLFYARI